MSEYSLRQYLQMRECSTSNGVRACCGMDDISLRALLSSFSLPIYEKWQNIGGASGRLGGTRGDQQKVVIDGHTFVVQRFDHGSIVDLGNGMVSAGLGGGTGGGALLPETPYRLTLQKVVCRKKTEGEELEGGEDELWARFIFATEDPENPDNPVLKKCDYHNDHVVPSEEGYDVENHVIFEGSLPEFFNLTLLAIEVDYDKDAEEVMLEYDNKLSQELGLWFTPGNNETESRLAFNLWANRIAFNVLMGFGDFWTKAITMVMGPAMEALLQGLQKWYKAELIGALTFPPLGEYLRKLSAGELPSKEPPQQITVFGYQSESPLFMKLKYMRSDDGAILEERRFFGGEANADYSFILRHWLGNSSHGTAPTRSIELSISSEYHGVFDPNNERSHFTHSENELSFDRDWSEYGYFLERSVNGAPFVIIASISPTAVNRVSYTDYQHAGERETCSYRVRAYNQSGYGPYSNTVVSALPVPSAPPYGLSASKNLKGPAEVDIHIYWMDDCSDNDGYDLERSRQDAPFTELAWVNALNPSTLGANYIDRVSNSFLGEKIKYRVRSLNEYGRGPYSEIFEITV